MKFYNIKQAQKEALNQINTTFKLSEIRYGKGFYEGQMQERKYWQDKIKAKIKEVKDGAFDAKIVLQLLLEKEE